ncbi:Four and a half LIM domains protein 2 [Cryptotermes secundus]|uniref:Four and a half LIM domains protein 2 n=1 Tax=Cryptotermes secundus TaxID=105785 RepID=A0A2J7QVP5_9NEOP|nr:Four and a half LIM domains protein 2 [Cryptotermes secundus]
MATDVLAEKFETRLHLTTKTVGEDRIKKAKENNEDVAVLSTFLPSPDDGKKKNIFECALKEDCLLGDPKKAIAAQGQLLLMKSFCCVRMLVNKIAEKVMLLFQRKEHDPSFSWDVIKMACTSFHPSINRLFSVLLKISNSCHVKRPKGSVFGICHVSLRILASVGVRLLLCLIEAPSRKLPGRSSQTKNLSQASMRSLSSTSVLGSGGNKSSGRDFKPWVPCRSFTARKRTSYLQSRSLSQITDVSRPTAVSNTTGRWGKHYRYLSASRAGLAGWAGLMVSTSTGTKKMEYKTRQWHEKCFCCCVCKTAIGTKSFIPREQEIYCATCYEEKFATRCVKCNKIITSGGVTYKNEPWHRECFTCTHCNTSLAGQRFTSRDEKPYCADCFGELFAKRCTSCSKPITGIGGTRFISFEDRHWHNDCFICATCKTSLVGRGFITDADDIICPECAKQKLM